MAGPEKIALASRGERPRLLVAWGSGWGAFRECVRALLVEAPLLPAHAQPAFRDIEFQARRHRWAYPASAVLHVLFWLTPLPAYLSQPSERPAALAAPRIEYDLTWTGTSRVLPPLSPAPRAKRAPGPGGQKDKPLPKLGAEAVASQTIISNPPEPNHPRQTLLRQNALEDKRFQTADVRLPNMIIPPAPAPTENVDLERIKIPGAPVDLTGPPRLRAPSRRRNLKGLRLLDAKVVNPLPRLEVPPAAAGDALAAGAADVPPGVPRSGDQIIGGILALSAQPAPPGRIGDLPDTNLHALFAVGPYLGPGSPAGVPEGVLGGEGGEAEGPGGLSAGFGGLNTEGIFVAPAGPVPPGPVVVGPATNDATDTTSSALQRAAPAPQPAEPPQVAPRQTDKSARERAEEMLHDTLPGAPRAPARRRIYTIYINMPNLTSQAGSWVLRFAELNEREASWPGGAGEPPLAAPLATKKVDPGYSAAARRDRIEGTVFLYGVIEPDGSVRDVQVVRGLHAALDQRAVEAFQRWRFEPGRKNGAAVALEVVVEIPFHLQALF